MLKITEPYKPLFLTKCSKYNNRYEYQLQQFYGLEDQRRQQEQFIASQKNDLHRPKDHFTARKPQRNLQTIYFSLQLIHPQISSPLHRPRESRRMCIILTSVSLPDFSQPKLPTTAPLKSKVAKSTLNMPRTFRKMLVNFHDFQDDTST